MITVDQERFKQDHDYQKIITDFETIQTAVNDPNLTAFFGVPSENIQHLFILLKTAKKFFEKTLQNGKTNEVTLKEHLVDVIKYRDELNQIINTAKMARTKAQILVTERQ